MCCLTCMHCARDPCVFCAWSSHTPPPLLPTLVPSLPASSFSAAPITQSFGVWLLTNYRNSSKAHLIQWNDLNLYSCLQVSQKNLCMRDLVVHDIYIDLRNKFYCNLMICLYPLTLVQMLFLKH